MCEGLILPVMCYKSFQHSCCGKVNKILLDFRCPWHSSKLWWVLVFPFLFFQSFFFFWINLHPSDDPWMGSNLMLLGSITTDFLVTILQIIMLCHKFEWYHFIVSPKFGGSGRRCCYLSTVIFGLWHFSPTLSWSGHFSEHHPRMYCYTPKFRRIAVFKVNIWCEGSLLLVALTTYIMEISHLYIF